MKRLDGTTEVYEPIERDPKGNIAEWGLTEKSDLHGNTVKYKYENVDGTAYLSEVNYTGFVNEEGAYTIKINRKNGRADATSSGRKGFLQRDGQLLSSIDVFYKNQVFRRYLFEYEEGQFKKTLLVSVSETDGNGNVLYANKFGYHDDIGANGGKLFSDEVLEAQTASKFGSDWHFKALDDDFSSHLSNINGASSTGRGLTTGANFGVGFSAASVYGGASYIHNKNEGEGQIVLTDIDGDGLPDRVFRFGNFLFYQPNLYAETGRLSFGAMKRIEGISQIGFTKSVSNGVGADVGIGYGWLSAGCSYSYTKDVSKTKVYFQDFNGDGLVDLADNGTVYFNRIVDGVPTFEKSSFGTPNPIAGTPETVLKALTARTMS